MASSKASPARVILRLCRKLGIPCVEKTLQRYDLYTADECFLTGTAAEVIPVTKIDGRPIGTGKAGPITRQADRSVPQVRPARGSAVEYVIRITYYVRSASYGLPVPSPDTTLSSRRSTAPPQRSRSAAGVCR